MLVLTLTFAAIARKAEIDLSHAARMIEVSNSLNCPARGTQ